MHTSTQVLAKQKMERYKRYKNNLDYLNIFLPDSVVELAMNIAKIAQISTVDEMVIILNLHHAFYQVTKSDEALKEKDFNERSIFLFIINVMRLTEKIMKTSPQFLSKNKIRELFTNAGVTEKDLIDDEFATFSKINFKLLESPQILIDIHQWIPCFLGDKVETSNEKLFEIALDIMKVVLLKRKKIYER